MKSFFSRLKHSNESEKLNSSSRGKEKERLSILKPRSSSVNAATPPLQFRECIQEPPEEILLGDFENRLVDRFASKPLDAIGERRNPTPSGERKVTFKSPPPAPAASVVLDSRVGSMSSPQEVLPKRGDSIHRPDPVSRPGSSRQSFIHSFPRPSSSGKASFPSSSFRGSSPTKLPLGVFSPSPSEMSAATGSTASSLPVANTWSEMTDPDLVDNLGMQERTRQEVLWEIVSSEERYLNDLLSIDEAFCKPLVHSSTSPRLEFYDPFHPLAHTRSATSPTSSCYTPSVGGSSINLPIASKFASTAQFTSPSDSSTSSAAPLTPNEDLLGFGFGSTLLGAGLGFDSLNSGPARLTASNTLNNAESRLVEKSSTVSLKRQSLPPLQRAPSSAPSRASAVSRTSFHKLSKHPRNSSSDIPSREDVELPEDLALVLKAINGGILEGHLKLTAALRRRYDDQYPLVRSLADIFIAHSYVLREYSTYVLHLEKALQQVTQALSPSHPPPPISFPKPKRASFPSAHFSSARQPNALTAYLTHLESLALASGSPGLLISLSKPFQRLIKYPLMFQNLLYHTDPSLKEYEKTVEMVEEIEGVVRALEDEKIGEEEREETRDIWGRIAGLDGDKVLLFPKSSRLLIGETPLSEASPSTANLHLSTNLPNSRDGAKPLLPKKSSRKLSDILKGQGAGKDELWVVRFTDMSLLCAKTGTTTLPLSISPKKSEKKRGNGAGRKGGGRERNIYKFVRVWAWHMDEEEDRKSATHQNGFPRTSPSSRSHTLPTIPGTPLNHFAPGRVRPQTHHRSGPSKLTPSKVRSMGDLSPAQYDRSPGLEGLRGFARRSKTFGPAQGPLGERGEEEEDDDDEESMMSFVFGDGDILIPAEQRLRKKIAAENDRDGSVSGAASSVPSRLDESKGESGSNSRMSGVELSSANGNANAKRATYVRLRPSAQRSSTLPLATNPSASASAPATTITTATTRQRQPRAVSLATTTASANAKFANRLRPLPANRDTDRAYVSEGESAVKRGVGRESMRPVMVRPGSAASNVSAASRLSGPAPIRGPTVGSRPMNRAISQATTRGNDGEKEREGTIRVRPSSSTRQRPWSTTISAGSSNAPGTNTAQVKRASMLASAASVTVGRRSITPLSPTSPSLTAHPTKTASPVAASTITTRTSSRAKPGVGRGRMSMLPSTVASANVSAAASCNNGAAAGISAATAARRARVSNSAPCASTGTLTPSSKANPPSNAGAAAKTTVKPNTTVSARNKPAPTSTLPLDPKSTATNGRAAPITGVQPAIRPKGISSPSPNVRTTANTRTWTPSTRAPQRKGIPTMPSMDTALAEVWKEYGDVDIDKLGSSTPRKAVPKKETAKTTESVKAPARVSRVPAIGGGGSARRLNQHPLEKQGSVQNKTAPVTGRIEN
ncbi:hypothetical protein D1P53_002995 [Cryptococcus gattii VGV]|nr:hypothetical protein D1P53_002995 [Cryptococcus gattii VGV]